MERLKLQYRIRLPSKEEKVFDVDIELNEDHPSRANTQDLPEWTRLEYCQCSHCPLSSAEHEFCPVAANLSLVVKDVEELQSFEVVDLQVESSERHVSTRTTAQRSLSSLIGLLMVTSGCPHTEFFKPMARYHLPLASSEETLYRVLTMYLTAEFYRHKEGHPIDFELAGLKKIYRNLHIVNAAMAERLRTGTLAESTINGIVLLDTYTQTMPFDLVTAVDELRELFRPFLDRE